MVKTAKSFSILGLALFLVAGSVFFFCTKTLQTPSNFRMMTDDFRRGGEKVTSKEGLGTLNASGSGLLQENTLKRIVGKIPEKNRNEVYVIDLRQGSSHFYKGVPIRWYGWEFSTETGEVYQKNTRRKGGKQLSLFTKGFHSLKWTIRRFKDHVSRDDVEPINLESERDLVQRMGLQYALFDGIRHKVHRDEQIDQFIEFANNLPKDAWLHFHCGGGRGRTSIFLTLFDIMKNGKEVPLEDIVVRQHRLGGEDMFDVQPWSTGTWDKRDLEARKQLMINFHAYVNDPNGYGKTTWSAWSKIKGIAPPAV